MIAVLRSWLVPAARRQRRNRRIAQPLTEALETRTVLSVSITANIDGVMPAVVSLTTPQPTASGAQEISLVVKLSEGVTKLHLDAASGKILHNVSITLSDVENGTETIDLIDAVIASYRFIQGPAQDEPSIALTLVGETWQTGSIAANIDGVMPSVVSLTIPQPTTDRAQEISLVVKLSRGATTLFHDAATEKVIPAVEITLDRIGNGSTETIELKRVLISSIQFVGAADIPEVKITLVAGQETSGIPAASTAGVRGGGTVELAQTQ